MTFEEYLGSRIRKLWRFIGCASNKERRIRDNSQNLIQTSEWVKGHQLKWRQPRRMKCMGKMMQTFSWEILRFLLIIPGQVNNMLDLRR